jgi:hypothetical protein
LPVEFKIDQDCGLFNSEKLSESQGDDSIDKLREERRKEELLI